MPLTTDGTRPEPARIGPGDPRYAAVVEKRFNKRFTASPDYVQLVGSTEDVATAVAEAVREARRLVVTTGGHCFEGFVSDPDVRVIIDVSPMKRVYYDAERRAIAVEAGATVGETFRALFETPEASGQDPSELLPRAPKSITTFKAEWSWTDIDARSFSQLLRNHGDWCERSSHSDSPYASLWTLFEIHRRQFGKFFLRGVSTSGAAATTTLACNGSRRNGIRATCSGMRCRSVRGESMPRCCAQEGVRDEEDQQLEKP